jgi:hypothetical protein
MRPLLARSRLPRDAAVEKILRAIRQLHHIADRVVRDRAVGAEHALAALRVVERAELIAQSAFAELQAEVIARDVFDGVGFI